MFTKLHFSLQTFDKVIYNLLIFDVSVGYFYTCKWGIR